MLSPDLLATLSEMGHGDEILLADAHFPAYTYNENVLRADGVRIPDLLGAILPLFELDTYVNFPLIMMAPVEGDALDPAVEESYRASIKKANGDIPGIQRMERYDFYDRAVDAFAVVITGELAKYGNIILRKGVTAS